MPDLHELLAREASRGGPISAPPFETLVARSRRRRFKQALAAAAAVVAVTAAVVPLIGRGSGPVVAGPAITTDAARRAAAQLVVNQLVADVKLPAGATPLATPPGPLASESPTKDTVIAERFFTVAGTMDSVVAYVNGHPPTGLVESGTSTETVGTAGSNTVGEQGVNFTGTETSTYEAPELSVAVVPQGTGVEVRVAAQATLRPVRTSAEFVPANVAAVTVTYRPSDGAARIYSWESPQAQVLADALNALSAQGSDITDTGCAQSNAVYTVTFEVSHQPLVFADYGCGFIAVTAGGISQPALEPGSVESRLFSMLGLQPAPESSAPPNGSVPPGGSSPAPSP